MGSVWWQDSGSTSVRSHPGSQGMGEPPPPRPRVPLDSAGSGESWCLLQPLSVGAILGAWVPGQVSPGPEMGLHERGLEPRVLAEDGRAARALPEALSQPCRLAERDCRGHWTGWRLGWDRGCRDKAGIVSGPTLRGGPGLALQSLRGQCSGAGQQRPPSAPRAVLPEAPGLKGAELFYQGGFLAGTWADRASGWTLRVTKIRRTR